MAGYVPSPGLAAYSATKFAVRGLSEALRAELAERGVGVTAICPGFIDTPITRSTRAFGRSDDPELRERLVRFYQRRGYGPEKVADRILKAVKRERIVAPVAPEAWIGFSLTRYLPRATAFIARKGAEAGRR
jgi:short-subunit dehydrogenase